MRNHIALKVDFVWRDICKKLNADLCWYSFSNDLLDENINETDGGFFNHSKKNQIKNELEKLKEAIVMFKDNDLEIINRINSFAELVENEKI